MALITCPDCGRKVSDLAKSCPECGRPIQAEVVAQQPKEENIPMEEPKAEFSASLLRSELVGLRDYYIKQFAIIIACFVIPCIWLTIKWGFSYEPVFYSVLILIVANIVIPLFRFGRDNIQYTAIYYTGLGTGVLVEEDGGWLGIIIGVVAGGAAILGFTWFGLSFMGETVYSNYVMLLVIAAVAVYLIARKLRPCMETQAYISTLTDDPDELTFLMRRDALTEKLKHKKRKRIIGYILFAVLVVILFLIGGMMNKGVRNEIIDNLAIDEEILFEELDERGTPYHVEDFQNIKYEVTELDERELNCHLSAVVDNSRNSVDYQLVIEADMERFSDEGEWQINELICYYKVEDIGLSGVWTGNASDVTATSTSADKITLNILECTKDAITAELTYVEKKGEVHDVLLTGAFRVMSETQKGKMEGEHLIVEFIPDEKFSVFFEVYSKVKMEIDFLNNQIYWGTCEATLLPQ